MSGYKLVRIGYFIIITFLVSGSIGYNKPHVVILFAIAMFISFIGVLKYTYDLENRKK